jgi:hypothetical protein
VHNEGGSFLCFQDDNGMSGSGREAKENAGSPEKQQLGDSLRRVYI